jgi:hypothetical protein
MKSFKELREACWDRYTQKGMKKKGDRMVPNCVPVKEDGMGAGAMGGGPTNVVGGGAIAGVGQPPGSKSGEPGVYLKKKKSNNPVIQSMVYRKPPKI